MPACGVRDDGYYAARLFAEILGGGMASRLYQKIREERGLAYSVYAYLDAYDDIGTVGVYLGADEAQARDALGYCLDEIVDLSLAVGDEELARAKALLRASLLMGLESPLARAERAAGQLFSFGRRRAPAEIVAAIDAVTPDQVRAVAQRALDAKRTSLAVVGAAPFDKLCALLRENDEPDGTA